MKEIILYVLVLFGPSIIILINYFIKIKLMRRRFRKEIELESKQWKAKMTEKYGIEFKT